VTGLQNDICQALGFARAVENALLDLTALINSSYSYKADTIRIMDELCRRIMSDASHGPAIIPPYARTSAPMQSYNNPPHVRQASQDYPTAYSQYRYSAGATPSPRSPPVPYSPHFTPPQRELSQNSHQSSSSWTSQQYSQNNAGMAPADEGYVDGMSEMSLHDSAIGSENGSLPRQGMNCPSPPLTNMQASQYAGNQRRTSSNLSIQQTVNYVENFQSARARFQGDVNTNPNAADDTVAAHEAARALRAPEVIPQGFEFRLQQQDMHQYYQDEKSRDRTKVHPALRMQRDYNALSTPGPDGSF
jgi:hypothetical protein